MRVFRALFFRQPRMQDCDLIAEPIVDIRGNGRSETDFGNQKNRRASLIKDSLHRRQIHCGFSGSGHAMHQNAAEFACSSSSVNSLQGRQLRGRKVLLQPRNSGRQSWLG